jgi:hypothetical protein
MRFRLSHYYYYYYYYYYYVKYWNISILGTVTSRATQSVPPPTAGSHRVERTQLAGVSDLDLTAIWVLVNTLFYRSVFIVSDAVSARKSISEIRYS